MSVTLRDYQHECIHGGRRGPGIVRCLREHRSTLAVSPTGTGKTEIFCAIAKLATKKVLVLADRKELVEQTHKRIEQATGLHWSIEMGPHHARRNSWFKGTVGCVPSVKNRLEKYRPDEFGLIVIDEADLSVAKSYLQIIGHFKDAKILGVTATPKRRDNKALGNVFDSTAFEYRLPDAIDDGWLVEPMRLVKEWVDVDFAGIKCHGEELDKREVAKRVKQQKAVFALVGETMKYAEDRPTIVFAIDIEQAEAIADAINDARPGAAFAASCETDPNTRASCIESWKRGDTQFFVNVNIATRGFDHPACSMVVNGAPTGSWARFMQRMGRGTRPLKGVVDGLATPEERRAAIAASAKPDFLFLDFTDASDRHELVHPEEALAGEPLTERERKCLSELRRDGRIMAAREAVTKAKEMAKAQEAEIERLKEASRPKLVVATKGKFRAPRSGENPVSLDPEAFQAGLSPKQVARLRQQKYPVDDATPDELRSQWKDFTHRLAANMPSRAQENFIKSFKVPVPATRAAAAALLDRLILQRRHSNVASR
jgi:superfamily II DNA or RNA helicase